MKRQANSKLYDELRKKFPVFIFEGYDYTINNNALQARFNFELPQHYSFHPQLEIPSRRFLDFGSFDKAALENLLFHIGMVELVSYWKATCSPLIIIRSQHLNDSQLQWFRKLYFKGLGEFYYLNGIDPGYNDFVEIRSEGEKTGTPFRVPVTERYLVPVGGGKDSIVTLELLKKDHEVRPLIINPRGATLETALHAGFGREEILEIRRGIHPQLLKLNDEGFLNGHTPFSALIAFISLLSAGAGGYRNIALSNEASADESSIPGTDVNHQYSKTYEFENDFRDYTSKYLTRDINYFSFLRPLHEIQIAKIFSGFPQFFGIFKSCNAGSKTDEWCGICAKCLFTYIILSPFLEADELITIFGRDLFDDWDLKEIFDELTGLSETKPFDCIGTVDEVNLAIGAAVNKYENQNLPKLLAYYAGGKNFSRYSHSGRSAFLQTLSDRHFLDDKLMNIIKERL